MDEASSSSDTSLDQNVVSGLADFIDALNKSSSSNGSDSVDKVEASSDAASSVASTQLDENVLQSLGDFIDRLHHQNGTASDANDAIQVTTSSSSEDNEAEVDPETLQQIASYIDTVTKVRSAHSPTNWSEKGSAGGVGASMDSIERTRATTNGQVDEVDALDIGYSASTDESPHVDSIESRIEDTPSIKEEEAVELSPTTETEADSSVSQTTANQGDHENLMGLIGDGYDSDRFTEINGEAIEIGADSSSFDEIEANRDSRSDEGINDIVSTNKLLERALNAAHLAIQSEQSLEPEIGEPVDAVAAYRSQDEIVECVESISRSESSLAKVKNDSMDSSERQQKDELESKQSVETGIEGAPQDGGSSVSSESLSKVMASLDFSKSDETVGRSGDFGIEQVITPRGIGNVSNAKSVDVVSEAHSHDSKSSTEGSADSESLSKVMASLELNGSGETTDRNAELSGVGIEHVATDNTATVNMRSTIETQEETARESAKPVCDDGESLASVKPFHGKGESGKSAENETVASGLDEAKDGIDKGLFATVGAAAEDAKSSKSREGTSSSEWTEEEVLTSSWDETVEITIGTSSRDNTLAKKSSSKSLSLSVSDGNNDVTNSDTKTDEAMPAERNGSEDTVDDGSLHEECAKDIRNEDLFTSTATSSFRSTEKGDDPIAATASASSREAPTPEGNGKFLKESVLKALEAGERTESIPAVRDAPSDDRESYLFNAFLAGSDMEISVDPIIRDYSTMDSIDEDDNIAKFQQRTSLRTASSSSSDAQSEDSDKLTEINGEAIELSKDIVVDDGINLASASVAKVTEIITHVSESDSESALVKSPEAGDVESQDSYLFNAFLLASASDISVDPILPDPSTMKSLDEDENIERFLAKTFTLPEGSTKRELTMLNTFIKEATDLIQNGGTIRGATESCEGCNSRRFAKRHGRGSHCITCLRIEHNWR